MLNWRQQTVANLAVNPEAWIHLGELFAGVESMIPPHLAFRRIVHSSRGSEVDVGLHTARWRMFLTHVRPLVDRQNIPTDGDVHTNPRLQRSEFVRLKPDKTPCEDCGGNRYLSCWRTAGSSRVKPTYKCPTCDNLKYIQPPEPKSPEVMVASSVVKPKKSRRRRGRYTPPPIHVAPQQLPKPKPIRPPKIKPEPAMVPVILLATANSIDQLWEMYKDIIKTQIPSFRENSKLRKMLYRAIEVGAFDQYERMSHFKTSELQILQTGHKEIWTARAILWMNSTFTPPHRRRWGAALAEAYGFGSLFILALTKSERLTVIFDEMESLRMRLEPQAKPPKQPKTIKQRWSGASKAVARWFIG